MNTRLVKTVTSDNLVLQGAIYEPEKATDKIVLHIHGMAGNFYENKFLDVMARRFTEGGWSFISVNTRGHDYIAYIPIASDKEESKSIGDFREKFEECVMDIKAWIDFVSANGYSKVVLQGHSLGSAKIAYYLSETQDARVTKLVLASPPDMVGLAEADKNHARIMSVANKMIKDGKGEELIPELIWDWAYLSARTYVDLGIRNNPVDVFNTYDKNKSSILSKIKIPILAFLGSKDDAAIFPVREALEIIKSKAKNCPRFDTWIVDGGSHHYFGHEEEVAEKIVNWLEK